MVTAGAAAAPHDGDDVGRVMANEEEAPLVVVPRTACCCCCWWCAAEWLLLLLRIAAPDGDVGGDEEAPRGDADPPDDEP